jgi:DNA-binding response OmpR family regulator
MKRILVIDDDVLVLKTLKKLLQSNGYEVETASTGQEGVERQEAARYDLIICDMRMPGLDGIGTIAKIRGNDRSDQSCPIIFVTGYASEDAPIEAIKLGAKDYILKPFDLDELLDSVKRCISQS